MSPTSFVEAFVERVDRFPDKVAFRYLGAQQGGVEHPTASVTYRELLDRAKATAARLQAIGGVGDRVVLAHTPGLDFVVDLLACQLAGMAPVPVYPPMGHREIETATAIAGLVRPVAVLSDLAPVAEPIAAGVPGAVVLTADDRDPAAAARWRDPAIGPDTLALLQFTSGSTGAPKGVEITHRNMLANQRRIHAAYGHHVAVGDLDTLWGAPVDPEVNCSSANVPCWADRGVAPPCCGGRVTVVRGEHHGARHTGRDRVRDRGKVAERRDRATEPGYGGYTFDLPVSHRGIHRHRRHPHQLAREQIDHQIEARRVRQHHPIADQVPFFCGRRPWPQSSSSR